MQELLSIIGDSISKDFQPYSMEDVKFFAGVPPVTHDGVHLVRAFRSQPKAKLFNSFTGGGAFVSNRNLNGALILTIATESPAHAHIQLLDIAGVAFPVYCLDVGTNGSSFIASSACRVVLTPEWAKSARSDFTTYTLACKRMVVSGGIRDRI